MLYCARYIYFLGFLFVCFLCITPAAAQTTTATTPKVYLPLITGLRPVTQSIEQRIVDLTNQQRQLNGCNVLLTLSPKLTASAYGHSQDMAMNDFFSHIGSNSSQLQDRVSSADYNYQLLGENIAVGYSTAQAVVNAWMSSAGHRANILNCNYKDIGVGYYYQADDQANVRTDSGKLSGPFYYYWTEDFGLASSQ